MSEAAPTMNQTQTNTEKEGKQEGETGKQTTRKNTEVTAATHIPLHFTNAVHFKKYILLTSQTGEKT